jgi:hypothetical protein
MNNTALIEVLEHIEHELSRLRTAHEVISSLLTPTTTSTTVGTTADSAATVVMPEVGLSAIGYEPWPAEAEIKKPEQPKMPISEAILTILAARGTSGMDYPGIKATLMSKGYHFGSGRAGNVLMANLAAHIHAKRIVKAGDKYRFVSR